MQLLVGQGGGGTGGSGCCEGGRTIMTDPVSGQPVCSCQYDRLAIGSYSRIGSSLGASGGVYGTTYTSSEQNPYPSIGMDSSAFYSPLCFSSDRLLPYLPIAVESGLRARHAPPSLFLPSLPFHPCDPWLSVSGGVTRPGLFPTALAPRVCWGVRRGWTDDP
ncbi:Homeobox protein araucan [Portunus trituberculatus]|uniref:Homeobox protein araucan n=1 Tax=Portunus trituberculatus TaxID=210409 RepID=A0A5B7GIL9_PORTR|nr:Homeobox protein araucan [Portunus trituberculatus]